MKIEIEVEHGESCSLRTVPTRDILIQESDNMLSLNVLGEQYKFIGRFLFSSDTGHKTVKFESKRVFGPDDNFLTEWRKFDLSIVKWQKDNTTVRTGTFVI